MILRLIAFVAAASLPGVAYAAPIHMVCSFEKSESILITVDEVAGTAVVHVASIASTTQFDARFSATLVEFGGRMISYSLDRSSLVIRRSIRMVGDTDVGQCVLRDQEGAS